MHREKIEKAILVGVKLKKDKRDFELSMEELDGLVEAAGGQVVATLIQTRERTDAATFIGKGKLEELRHLIAELETDLVVFDRELSPVQQRNLEAELETKIIDRSMLILEIFSQRARSREGKLQVELATMEYKLPRLTGLGSSMSRLGAGIGTRGAGEQKRELDKRYLRKRINDIKEELQRVKSNRQTQKKRRERNNIPVISLAGYTNAGKSSLFNLLCTQLSKHGTAQVEADNRLFQTLDTTTRKIKLPSGREILLSDSVGFIQNLPHHLVAAFSSTLEEVAEADLILQVIDVSNPDHLEQIQVVEKVLKDLGADQERILKVFNKVDKLDTFPQEGIFVSALTGQGIDRLLQVMEKTVAEKAEMK